MNTIIIALAAGIIGFAAGRLKNMRFFQPGHPKGQWVFVPADKLPEVQYVIDEKSAFSSSVDRLFLSKES